MIKSRCLFVLLFSLAPLVGHAQLNQLSGLVQSARDAASFANGLVSSPASPAAQADQLPLHPGRGVSEVVGQRGRGQTTKGDLDAATRAASACPALVDERFSIAERFIRCRNGGLSEDQQMAFVGAMPISAQGYMAAMVQDVYEDNVTDPRRGKEITDYYDSCYRRGTPCVRRRW